MRSLSKFPVPKELMKQEGGRNPYKPYISRESVSQNTLQLKNYLLCAAMIAAFGLGNQTKPSIQNTLRLQGKVLPVKL